jgi:DNA-binding SARP family transcriptional activator
MMVEQVFYSPSLFQFITSCIVIFFFLGLAIHVIAQDPRRPISYAFAAYCLIGVIHYFTSLILPASGTEALNSTPLPLRIKWLTSAFTSIVYLHFTSYYFTGSWRQRLRPTLVAGYTITALFAITSLVGNWFTSGMYPTLIAKAGILMPYFLPFYYLFFLIALAGLAISYRSTRARLPRRQILFLFLPALIMIAGSVSHFLAMFGAPIQDPPKVLTDILIIISGFFFAIAVVQHGSIIGRPIALRRIIINMGLIGLALTALAVTITLDMRLLTYYPSPFPLITGMFLAALIGGIPIILRTTENILRQLATRAGDRPPQIPVSTLEQLDDIADPKQLTRELLTALVSGLRARGGFIALRDDYAQSYFIVQEALGEVNVQPGERVVPPGAFSRTPLPHNALTPSERENSTWTNVGLYCQLSANTSVRGLLAIGRHQDGLPYQESDLQFLDLFARQLEVALQINSLSELRDWSLATAQERDTLIRMLEAQIMESQFGVKSPAGARLKPVELRILGPFEVLIDGAPVPDSAWESERARALLAYLLWKGPGGASRQEIAGYLWPNIEEEKSSANVFHVTVNRLRRVLEPTLDQPRQSRYIIYEGGKYHFSFTAPHLLDVQRFEQLSGSTLIDDLRQAVAIYRGPYLQDMDWAFPPALEATRRSLEARYESCLRMLILTLDGNERIEYLQRLLHVEPLDEPANVALIEHYLAHGRRDLASATLSKWRQTLIEYDLRAPEALRKLWFQVEQLEWQGIQAQVDN